MGAEHSHRHQPQTLKTENLPTDLANTILKQHKKHQQMDRLRRTLSFHNKKKENKTINNHTNKNEKKPVQWHDDDKSVRDGTCSFNVKYLGSVEVQESRGMHVCEQAIQALLNQKAKHVKAILYISGDALRVVDETNKGLIVDQTIEKVSFCAPDRFHENGFAYICRDGTTRRWLCHSFLAIKETGERLSHSVGCAFQVCLERKQRRDRDCNVSVEYTPNGTSFTKFGSFRSTSIIERIMDPQSAIVAGPIPCSLSNININTSNQKNNLIERPRPKGSKSDAFVRSISMRSDDFKQTTIGAIKRQYSLGPSDLPSIQESKYKNSLKNTIPEENEYYQSTTNELSKLSLFDSMNTNNHNNVSLPITKPSIIPISDESYRATTPVTNAFSSNLTALVQSNQPINPFSPYGYSMVAQAQSPDKNHQQSVINTPKRGNNPFDDDLIRR
ncbi:unnamed protein product [Adineta steineri]|uniref:PID domain-containing protein n=1 Tax=Adineta steineri TaxID=433720 RepID=A0A813Z569_9BILA|nr:unnamed protein product [Adineta steineri]